MRTSKLARTTTIGVALLAMASFGCAGTVDTQTTTPERVEARVVDPLPEAEVHLLMLLTDGSGARSVVEHALHSGKRRVLTSSLPCSNGQYDYDAKRDLLWSSCVGDVHVLDLREKGDFVHVAKGMPDYWGVRSSGHLFPDPGYNADKNISAMIQWDSVSISTAQGWYGDEDELAEIEESAQITPVGEVWFKAQSARTYNAKYKLLLTSKMAVTDVINSLPKPESEYTKPCGDALPLGDSTTLFLVCYEMRDAPEAGDYSVFAIFDSGTKLFAHMSDLSEGAAFTWTAIDAMGERSTDVPLIFNAQGTHVFHDGSVRTLTGKPKVFAEGEYVLGFLGGELHHGRSDL